MIFEQSPSPCQSHGQSIMVSTNGLNNSGSQLSGIDHTTSRSFGVFEASHRAIRVNLQTLFQFFSRVSAAPRHQIFLWLATSRMRIFLCFTQGQNPRRVSNRRCGRPKSKSRAHYRSRPRNWRKLDHCTNNAIMFHTIWFIPASYHVTSAGTRLSH
jgi:hypothetical protein